MTITPPIIAIPNTLSPLSVIISELLQSNWSLTPPYGVCLPVLTDITWATTRFDAAQDIPTDYAISCYNPAGPVVAEPLSREVWQFLEDVVIDILAKVVTQGSAGTAFAMGLRENLRAQVYNILEANKFNLGSGYTDVWPVREKEKVESPQLVRLTIMVRARSFNVKT
jgi:hypothetical protein